MKRCDRCGEEKPLEAFPAGRGKRNRCKACHAAIQREWRRKNPERARQLRRESDLRHAGAQLDRDREKRCRVPEYSHWKQMLSRCHNQRSPKYPSYGGRGIVVCPEWRAFQEKTA